MTNDHVLDPDEGCLALPPASPAAYTVLGISGRSLPERYQGLVFSRWLLSLRYGNEYFRYIRARSYFHHYHSYIGRVLQQRETLVRLAVLADDYDVALGFSVTRGNVLDYVHVQRDMRNQDIGTALVPEGIDTITHLTKSGRAIWIDKRPSWSFDPFA